MQRKVVLVTASAYSKPEKAEYQTLAETLKAILLRATDNKESPVCSSIEIAETVEEGVELLREGIRSSSGVLIFLSGSMRGIADELAERYRERLLVCVLTGDRDPSRAVVIDKSWLHGKDNIVTHLLG